MYYNIMKIKRLIYFMLSLSVMVSCYTEGDEGYDITNQLLGVWVFDKINNEQVPTNEQFAGAFIAGGSHNYLQWAALEDEESTLVFKDNSTWSLYNKLLTIKNEQLNDHIVLDIVISGDDMSWQERVKVVGGTDYYTGDSYQGYRVKEDYTSNITTGVWEGRATVGRTDNPYIRIKYNDDSTYDFQYRQSEDEPWSDKVDNDGHYYLIGNLLGSVWTNDINSGVEGSTSETWIISIEGDTMVWEATRSDDHFESFSFARQE